MPGDDTARERRIKRLREIAVLAAAWAAFFLVFRSAGVYDVLLTPAASGRGFAYEPIVLFALSGIAACGLGVLLLSRGDTEALRQQAAVSYRAERDRSDIENRFRAIVENAPEEISLKAPDGRYLLVNRRFEALAGMPAAEILGRTSDEIFGRAFAESGIDHDREVIAARKAIEREEVFRAGARERELLTTKFPVFDRAGEVIAVGAVHVDLTQRKAVERLKGEFVSSVNHELRTPIAAIHGALTLAASGVAGESPPKAAELIELAKRNSERLLNLVDDLLDMEKIQSGRMSYAFEPIDIGDLAREAADSMAPVGEAHGVRFDVEIESGHLGVNGDRVRLTQVVVNLLSNAARFSGRSPVVELRARRVGSKVRVSVIDGGIGIPSDFNGDIFEPFARVNNSNTRESGGTGLGLGICKSIVEAHGGTIAFTSEQGRGSTFYFEVPFADGTEAPG